MNGRGTQHLRSAGLLALIFQQQGWLTALSCTWHTSDMPFHFCVVRYALKKHPMTLPDLSYFAETILFERDKKMVREKKTALLKFIFNDLSVVIDILSRF